MRVTRWLAAAATCAAAAGGARPASADPVDAFRPALDTRGYVTVDGGEVLGPAEPSFGIVTSWARGGMVGVDDVVMPTLVAAVGAPWGLEVAASLPFAVLAAPGGQSTQAIGDLALAAKLRAVDRGRWAVAVAGGVTLARAGDGRAIVEWRGERLRLAVNAGVRGRAPAAGAALSWSLAPGLDAIGELDEREVIAALRVRLAVSSHFTIGAGAGFGDAPELRAFAAIVFEPRAARVTRVEVEDPGAPPELAYQRGDEGDEGEPPDADTDHDHIADHDDLCIDEAGPPEYGGCPAPERTAVTDTAIVTLREINFEFDSDVITEDSYPVLDSVAKALEDNPDIAKLEIGGHTDARGKASYNLDLSRRRAEAVERYLIDAGVAADRLAAAGYGETRPKVRGTGERAWSQNRRVEFVIEERR